MHETFNDRLRQLLLMALIILIFFVLIHQLTLFIPGLLGGVTLYILSRSLYFDLIHKKKWKKGLTALLFIFAYLIIIAIPVYASIKLVSPKINAMLSNQDQIKESIKTISVKISDLTGVEILSDDTTQKISTNISAFIPRVLNSTLNLITNLIMMFFLLYYLLVSGKEVEKYLNRIIPLKRENVDKLAAETKLMIRANALGIPIICLVQGIFATLGYWLFGVEDWGLWGFITGVFAFFPLVGTMIVWVPLVVYLFATGHNWPAFWLTLYSIVVTGNVDYITRLGLLKKMGNIHPMITVLGVIVGLGMFGFMGLIFGPLLVSYFIILVKIYINEFTNTKDV
ncbi:AI-2E family transporter [soil metagenome]